MNDKNVNRRADTRDGVNSFPQEDKTDHTSRRAFIGLSSTALAAAAMITLPAGAQQRSDTRKALHDNSSSDPGPENKPLLAQNPNTNTPPPTDHGDVGPIWYSFDLVHKRVEEGGWTHQVTQREFPSSKEIAGVNMRLTAGGIRELHWHTADEWAYMLYGKARVTVLRPDGTIFINDVAEGDLWLFPAGHPHSIQGLGPDGCQFLLVFNQGLFSEDNTTLVTDWLAHTPPEVMTKNMKLTKDDLEKLPDHGLYIFQSEVPGPLAADIAETGAVLNAIPGSTVPEFTFKLGAMQPNQTSAGGDVRIVDKKNFPASVNFAAALVRVKPGAMREMHWHPNAPEWQYYIAGSGRMTVFSATAEAHTQDFNTNDVGYVPAQSGHYIENTGSTDLVFLETFAVGTYQEFALNPWLRRVPAKLAAAHLQVGPEGIARIPASREAVRM